MLYNREAVRSVVVDERNSTSVVSSGAVMSSAVTFDKVLVLDTVTFDKALLPDTLTVVRLASWVTVKVLVVNAAAIRSDRSLTESLITSKIRSTCLERKFFFAKSSVSIASVLVSIVRSSTTSRMIVVGLVVYWLVVWVMVLVGVVGLTWGGGWAVIGGGVDGGVDGVG